MLAPEIVNDPTVFPIDRSAKITFYARWIPINYTFVWVPDQFERVRLHNEDGVYCLVRGTWIPNAYTDCALPVLDDDGEPELEKTPQTMTVTGSGWTLTYTFAGLHWGDDLPDLSLLLDAPQRNESLALEYHHEGVYFSPELEEKERVPGHNGYALPDMTVSETTRFDPTKSAASPLSALDIVPWAAAASPDSADGLAITPLAAAALTPQAQAFVDNLGADVVFWGKTTSVTIPCANGALDPPTCTPGAAAIATPHIANTGVEVLYLLWVLLGLVLFGAFIMYMKNFLYFSKSCAII
ncbi:hypothetical protein FACS1894125_4660 [Actinomycetota bacterium]|nr:hypothetical protein FACS1894125_4660 [Actinomycetota bacterium]